MLRGMLVGVGCLALVSGAQAAPVKLPAGVTSLADIGRYEVAWQSYDGPVVAMPESWAGHFEETSGISYQPGAQVLGRRSLLLHSPWRVAPGKAWVDYELQLPDLAPLEFLTGIAMRPDVLGPERSDGVTFSAFLDGRELFRQHCAEGRWEDLRFDLSARRGQTVTLRLQVEPGPDNNASFDFSYWGDPRIVAGSAEDSITRQLDAMTSSKAYRAVDAVSLTAVANRSGGGIEPSMLLPQESSLTADGDAWVLTSLGADATVVYRYQPATGTLDDWTVQVDGGTVLRPMAGGGVRVGDRLFDCTVKQVEADPAEGVLTVVWDATIPARPGAAGLTPVTLTWRWRLAGKALVFEATADGPGFTGLSLGTLAGAALRRAITMPYLPVGGLQWLPEEQLYTLGYLDWTQSHGSRSPGRNAVYDTTTDGDLNPLVEQGYVAVSPSLPEVLPNIPWPASGYRDLLGPRIMLDIWGHQPGGLAADAVLMTELKDQGIDHIAIIQHAWQRYGYDVKLPDHLPTNPAVGGDEGMIAFGQAANAAGYIWSVHENYIDLYPDAPSYDPTARVLQANGEPSPAWFNRSTQTQSFGLKCDRALGYAEQNSPEIHRRFGTTAAYLDVHTCVAPWHQLDHDAKAPMAAMSRLKVIKDAELFDFERASHEGPLLGEGANHFYWAGQADGVEAQVAGGEDHLPLLELDLLKLHPQMVNHGMGYYERWFRQGYGHQWGRTTGTAEQVDKYRAQELAYGHAGFVGGAQVANIPWVAREHHLMHPVQALYGTARVTDLRYEVASRWVSGSAAAAVGQTLRQRIQYDSGLTIYVNWAAAPWAVAGRTLPQWGWLAEGPGLLAGTFLQDGHFADFVDSPAYLFADARTAFPMPYRLNPPNVEPSLQSFRYLGEGRAEITYAWTVGPGTALPEDLRCFVHFADASSTDVDNIVGQQDHQVPRPTSTWQPGEVIVDGPYTVELPKDHDAVKLLIGLYGQQRQPLLGKDDGGGRILIGTLHLERDGDAITGVTVEAPPTAEDQDADFTAHLNPAGTELTLGPIVTDGAIKVEKHQDPARLLVIPYPRGTTVRVALDLATIVPGAAVAQARVVALAQGSRAPLGPVAAQADGAWLRFETSHPEAGCYEITW